MQCTIEERNRLIGEHIRLVQGIASRIASKLPPGGPSAAELFADGVFGLLDAIEAFDPSRGVKLASYAQPRIAGAILDALRESDPVSRSCRQRQKLYSAARDQAAAELGRPPTDDELAERLGMQLDKFRDLWHALETSRNTSLDTNPGTNRKRAVDDNHEDCPPRDRIPDARIVPPDASPQRRDVLGLVTRGLTKPERLIVILYYYEGLNFKEIGATLGLSESRISQMHSRVIDFLRERLAGREREFEFDG